MINSILFFGGFDSQCNYKDARLLSLNNMKWYNLIFNNVDIDLRAHHSTCTRYILSENKFECYLFGGMYCDGGPYKYHNDMYKFTFYQKNDGYFTCNKIIYNDDNKEDDQENIPCKRSQAYLWIDNDKNGIYLYGGSYATSTLNDLWFLDLNTFKWNKLKYNGILGGPPIYNLKPRNFRIASKRTPCYYNPDMNELIVIHYGPLNEIQNEFIKYKGTLKQFNKILMKEFEKREKIINDTKLNDESKENEVINKKKPKLPKSAIGKLQETLICTTFVLNLKTMKWNIKGRNKNLSSIGNKSDKPTKMIGTTCIIRIGEYLVQLGGGMRNNNLNYMRNIYMLKIPYSMWKIERLLWIGHYSNDDNDDNTSIFNKCAKDTIRLIISFLNPRQ